MLVVNEVVDLAKNRKDHCFLLKADFRKAYDSVNQNFLDYILGRMGFNDTCRRCISVCIFSDSGSVLVNGSLTEDFSVKKGLRQGDPLAPFLFLIVAKSLSGLVCNAVSLGKLKGFKGK